MRRTASGLARPLLTRGGIRSSLSLGSTSSGLNTRYYSALSTRLDNLAEEAALDNVPTGEELANQLRGQNITELANNIQKLEAEFAKIRQPKPQTYTKEYEYVLNKLREQYAPPTSPVGKQLHALLIKYGDLNLSPEAKEKRSLTIRTLIQIDKESDLGKKLEHYRSLPHFEDPAKQKALDQALASGSDPKQKEQAVKDQLNWKESERKASDLKSRHPDFKELHQALDYFPPLVDVLGEPSVFHRKFAELALDGKDASEVNPVDFNEETRIPGDDKLDSVYELVKLAKQETPNNPNLALIDALEKHSQSESEFMAAVLSESRDWAQKRLQWANEMFRVELQASEDMKKMDVDEVLALHPEWAKEIEDDIVNYRWDPSIPKSEYDKAWAEYLSHWKHA